MVNLPKIAVAQINVTVGDFAGNCEKIIAACAEAKGQGADAVAFPELIVSGYPPEDLLYRPEFLKQESETLHKIADAIDIDCILGALYIDEEGNVYNGAYLIRNGKAKLVSLKKNLPNYGVFDERRYFKSGEILKVFEIAGTKVACVVCEDGWSYDRALEARHKGAEFIVSINASPFEAVKLKKRYDVIGARAKESRLPILYVHNVGGQDTIVFDGGSFLMAKNGEVSASLPEFEEVVAIPSKLIEPLRKTESRYRAMVLSLKDYVHKNGFSKVIIGLSGGVDSAIVAVIAQQALGAENVRLVMLPSKYTSFESHADAQALADNIGVKLENIAIEPAVEAFHEMLADSFSDEGADLTEENLQSRVRGVTLMALSNKFGALLLTTGNKSEMAVGYATLYGDMCGAFNPIKDLYKTEVFDVCRWINENVGDLIPENILTKAPTAELREGQKDEDSLPPYDVLDQLLMALVEDKLSLEEIVAKGFDKETVEDVTKLLYLAQYKRFQSAPGPKLSATSFGKDWRYPVTNKFK